MKREFIEEIKEEFEDFFEDLVEHILHHRSSIPKTTKKAVINGVTVAVRPAYLFAERIDYLLKIVFGASIIISAFYASFQGFTKLSDLLETLIVSFPGRIIMIGIGISYLLTALWKLMHLQEKM